LNEVKAKKWGCPVCRAKIDQVIKLYAVWPLKQTTVKLNLVAVALRLLLWICDPPQLRFLHLSFSPCFLFVSN
jgi:hypothetical protein